MNYDLYMNIVTNIAVYSIFVMTGVCYAVWLRDFLDRPRHAYLTGGIYAGLTILLNLIPHQMNGNLARAVVSLITLAVMILCERKKIPQKVFLVGVFYALRFLSFGFFAQINLSVSEKIYGAKLIRESIAALITVFTIDQIFWVVCNIAVLYCSVRILKKVYRRKCEDMTFKELLLLLIPIIVTWCAVPIINAYFDLYMRGMEAGIIRQNLQADIYQFFYYLISYLAIIIMMILYQKTKEQKEELQKQQMLSSRLAEMSDHIRQVEGLYGEIRALRHDIGNHVQTMEYLLAQGNKQQAESYLAKLREELRHLSPPVITGNPVLDVILQEKKREAAEKKIEMKYDFHLPYLPDNEKDQSGNKTIPAFIFDLSVILNNALNNAIEAASQAASPYIELTSGYRNHMFFIIVKNSFEGILHIEPGSGLPQTSKLGAGHGIGLLNIRQTAQKYLGEIKIEQQGNAVILYVMLQMPIEKRV